MNGAYIEKYEPIKLIALKIGQFISNYWHEYF